MRAVLQRVKSAYVKVRPSVIGCSMKNKRDCADVSVANQHPMRHLRDQVDGEVISEIGAGLVCLLGVGVGDTDADAEYM